MKYLISYFLISLLALSACSTPDSANTKSDLKFRINEPELKNGILKIELSENRQSSLSVQTPGGE